MTRRALAAALAPVGVALVVLAVGAGVLWGDLGEVDREAIAAVLTPPRVGLLVFFGLALVAGLAVLGYRRFAALALPARRLAEEARLIAQGNPSHRVTPPGAPDLAALATAVNE